ncbi:hypothetical protein G3I01_12015 [Gramella sp. MT6]|uniref:hypothetical protein n=1 Tax=Gramella sp. MT6 TaxID=2705471 RepID=UPI001C5CF4CB|nr:hypothetical protein [Gramella sp. MT6]QYA26202.1 hypothetical protein G3I01_12015 [Gramella sp. MT6]
MRSYYLKGIYLLIGMFLFSCSSDSVDDNNDEPSGDSYMKANFGDMEWEADDIVAQLTVVPDQGGQRFDVTAVGMKRKLVMATAEMDNSSGKLTTKVYENDFALMFFYFGFSNDFWYGNYADIPDFDSEPDIKITVTESSDTAISGTFSGTFYRITGETEYEGTQFPEVLTITNGVFNNIPFQKVTIPEGTLAIEKEKPDLIQ